MPKVKTGQSTKQVEIQVLEISQGKMNIAVVGTMPLYFNSVSAKAKRELLLPRGRLTQADKATNLKHDPEQEFRDSVYRTTGDDHPTRLCIPAPAFKGAMMTAALDIPGTRKTEIGRLTWIVGTHVPIWGIPKLKMDVTRNADINRTPDVRTRALVDRWATCFTVAFIKPKLTEKAIMNLLSAGGLVAGVGDFRQEKGKGNYGQFEVRSGMTGEDMLKLTLGERNSVEVAANSAILKNLDDPEFKQLMRTAGRVQQDKALAAAEPYDDETRDLLEWYHAEIIRRGRSKSVSDKKTTTRRRTNGAEDAIAPAE